MPTLTLSQLSRVYGPYKAVDGIDIVIKDGEFLSLLGPSGCGKTTTLRMIAGFVDPSGGSIAVDGRVLSSPKGSVPPEKRGMSMIFQSYAIWPNMTVAENVAFGLRLRKVPHSEMAQRLGKVLEIVQMRHLADRYPAELSGGQQQRVALARAIVVEPAVLLLDEPLSNLDAQLREEMRSEIRRLHETLRITTVYVTHDQAEAMATSDRIAVMNKGRIEQVDTPYQIYARPRTRFVAGFIGRTNFIEGKRAGNKIAFDGFAIDASQFSEVGTTDDTLTFSVRPQTLTLAGAAQTPADNAVVVTGRVIARTFLGEYWDYTFAIENSAQRLNVAAPPSTVFDVNQAARLLIDPRQMVAIGA